MEVRVSFTMPMPQGVTVTMLLTLLSRLLGNVTNLQVAEDAPTVIHTVTIPAIHPNHFERHCRRSLSRTPRRRPDER